MHMMEKYSLRIQHLGPKWSGIIILEVFWVRFSNPDTDLTMQLSVNKDAAGRDHPAAPQTLAHLKSGESGVLDRLDLPEDIARRLMELGFLPGHTVVPARSAPGGEPRVYQVDGSEVALRRETALRLILRPPSKDPCKALEP
jgi:ferrous iron transport protein A